MFSELKKQGAEGSTSGVIISAVHHIWLSEPWAHGEFALPCPLSTVSPRGMLWSLNGLEVTYVTSGKKPVSRGR